MARLWDFVFRVLHTTRWHSNMLRKHDLRSDVEVITTCMKCLG